MVNISGETNLYVMTHITLLNSFFVRWINAYLYLKNDLKHVLSFEHFYISNTCGIFENEYVKRDVILHMNAEMIQVTSLFHLISFKFLTKILYQFTKK